MRNLEILKAEIRHSYNRKGQSQAIKSVFLIGLSLSLLVLLSTFLCLSSSSVPSSTTIFKLDSQLPFLCGTLCWALH